MQAALSEPPHAHKSLIAATPGMQKTQMKVYDLYLQ